MKNFTFKKTKEKMEQMSKKNAHNTAIFRNFLEIKKCVISLLT